MTTRLDGIRAKLRRASDHLEELQRLVVKASAFDAYAIDTPYDSKERCFHLRVRIVHKPPIELGVVAGEVVQQLRSSLDHLAYQLADINGRPDESPNFPIYTSKAVYTTRTGKRGESPRDRCIAAFRPTDLARIEALQPYTKPDPNEDELAVLQRLSNIDKHAVIHTPFAVLGRIALLGVSPNVQVIPIQIGYIGEIEDEAVVAKFRLVRVGEGQMNVRRDVDLRIAFGTERFDVGAFEQLAIRTIGIIDEFEGALPELGPTP